MTTDNLDSLTDDQLSSQFAVDVLGRKLDGHGCMSMADVSCGGRDWQSFTSIPAFATSADVVLPWLEKQEQVSNVFEDGGWFVGIDREGAHHLFASASAPTFARSACIALIRASRATKGQSS